MYKTWNSNEKDAQHWQYLVFQVTHIPNHIQELAKSDTTGPSGPSCIVFFVSFLLRCPPFNFNDVQKKPFYEQIKNYIFATLEFAPQRWSRLLLWEVLSRHFHSFFRAKFRVTWNLVWNPFDVIQLDTELFYRARKVGQIIIFLHRKCGCLLQKSIQLLNIIFKYFAKTVTIWHCVECPFPHQKWDCKNIFSF